MSQTLAAPTSQRLEQFLVEAANLRLEPEAVRRFAKRFRDFDLFNERVVSALFAKPSSQGMGYRAAARSGNLLEKYPLLPSWDPKGVFYVDETADSGEHEVLRRLVMAYCRA